MKEIMTCKVVENRSIAPEIHQITFELPVEQQLCPGQFANVYLNDPSRLLPRPIGISRLQGTKLQLVYRTVGGGTALMAKMQPGETLRLSPPLGKGYDLPESGHVLLVGGGVGAPLLLGTADAAREKGLGVTAVLGYRSQLFLKDEFDAVCDKVCIATDDGSHGYHGNVVALLGETELPENTTVLACGPTPMLRALTAFCKEKNLPLQVSLEARMGCGYGACVGCVVKLDVNGETVQKRVCKDGPVFNGWEVCF